MSNWDTSTGQVSRVPVHQCDHTNCIPRSKLPGLPSEWQPPFAYATVNDHTGVGMECVHDANSRCMVFDCGHQTGKFLAALLNTCYLAPTATKEG